MTDPQTITTSPDFTIDFMQDLFKAYYCARKNKRNTYNQLKFELNYESNLLDLRDQILERRYKPLPEIAFIVNKPVKREIFAADFRDRVVHHLLFNYLNPVMEKYFINDCYSCRKNRGTSYGIKRMESFMSGCSDNYTKDCYILKLDIQGYFMSMNKTILYEAVKGILCKDKSKNGKPPFNEGLVDRLLRVVIFNDPTKSCRIKGDRAGWEGLPKSKSLFFARPNCGLPIGNLTSQLFGNVYLTRFDQFVKRDLAVGYYGRYVDDLVLVHEDRTHLKSLLPVMRDFLAVT